MNYLAHAYLSFDNKEILVGNIISDFIRGKAQYTYLPGIQKGIQLHRKIDQFTDEHEATQRAKLIFKEHYRLYGAVFTDILYDHFLARDKTIFPEETLYDFTTNVYSTLNEFTNHFPERFTLVFGYMQTENWLYNYRLTTGIEKCIRGVVGRASFITDSKTAFELFLKHYDFLQDCYEHLFKDVKLYAKQQFDQLVN